MRHDGRTVRRRAPPTPGPVVERPPFALYSARGDDVKRGEPAVLRARALEVWKLLGRGGDGRWNRGLVAPLLARPGSDVAAQLFQEAQIGRHVLELAREQHPQRPVLPGGLLTLRRLEDLALLARQLLAAQPELLLPAIEYTVALTIGQPAGEEDPPAQLALA